VNRGSSARRQLLAIPFVFALVLVCSFFYAVVLRDAWNWFVVPAVPVVQPLSYAQSYGIFVAIDVATTVFANVKSGSAAEDEASEDHPVLMAVLKALIKVVVVAIIWGFAAVVHVIVG
jgi:hypothetical protein